MCHKSTEIKNSGGEIFGAVFHTSSAASVAASESSGLPPAFAAEKLPTLVRALELHSAPELPEPPPPGSPSPYVQSRLRVIDVSSSSLMASQKPRRGAATETTPPSPPPSPPGSGDVLPGLGEPCRPQQAWQVSELEVKN